jgi:glycosyltransferase involved in cell wall biosynthesis
MIGLCMIVKDEEAVIERCLNSVRPWIDSWTIVDTGSSDQTPNLVRRCLEDKPGQLLYEKWVNFAHNRSRSLEHNRATCDYHLVIDADDWLEARSDFDWPELDLDSYSLEIHYQGVVHYRPQLLKASLPWCYQGAVHEQPFAAEAHPGGKLDGLIYHCGHGESARARDSFRFFRDAALLEEELVRRPDDPRTVFYLAQSYRDGGRLRDALETYRRRTLLEGWRQEVYYSYLQMGRLAERLGLSPAEIVSHYQAAFEVDPARSEALLDLARHHRLQGQYQIALIWARQAHLRRFPQQGLFLETDAYGWRRLDELALACHYTGLHQEAVHWGQALLTQCNVQSELPRLRANLNFYLNSRQECRWACAPFLE